MIPVPAERRSVVDRRSRPTPMLGRHALFGGRRRRPRRASETEGAYVDVHGPGMLAFFLAVLGLNVLDGFFTLFYLSYGGREANPVAAALLEWGPAPFLFVKCLGTGLALSFLVVHKHFRLGRTGLAGALVLYLGILAYHGVLLRDLVSVLPESV